MTVKHSVEGGGTSPLTLLSRLQSQ